MPLRIRINNLSRKRRIPAKAVKEIATAVLQSFRKKEAFLEITFIGNTKIAHLNKKYMDRTGATDVLSFSLEPLSAKQSLVGDIYVSSDMASSNAKRFGTSFKREILLYVVHGVLHLMGLGDKTQRERDKIRKLEMGFLSKWIGRHSSRV